jgi:hypothetical protein
MTYTINAINESDAKKKQEINQIINFKPEDMKIEDIYNHYKNTDSSNPAKDTLNIMKSTKENNKLIEDINNPTNLKDDISFEQTNPIKSTLNENIKSKRKSKKSESDYESDFQRNYPRQHKHYYGNKEKILKKAAENYKEGKMKGEEVYPDENKIINQPSAPSSSLNDFITAIKGLDKDREENEKISSDRNDRFFELAKQNREREIHYKQHKNVVKELRKKHEVKAKATHVIEKFLIKSSGELKEKNKNKKIIEEDKKEVNEELIPKKGKGRPIGSKNKK